MTDAQFDTLVTRLESFARAEPASYRRRVVALALLGDLYLWGMLFALAAVIGVSVWFVAELKVVALKLLIVLVPIAWLLGKALWVGSSKPEGVRVMRADAPELFALIDDIRSQIRAPEFHEVLIDGDFNAGVVQAPRLGVFGWFRNYLIIGLPLLKVLTPEQFKAVLAHEYGHLAGGHAKLSNWIYRQRLRWSRLLRSVEERGGEGGVLFMGFLKRYAPYLNAYSFPLARANEYEADAVAVRISQPAPMAQALTAVNVGHNYLSETFWPDFYRQASHAPKPEQTPYASFSGRLHADAANMPRQRWLESAMQSKTSTADTHPSLADRLGAIGAVPAIALPVSGQAADQLLGASLTAVTERLDAQWSERVADGWHARFQQATKDREALAALQTRRANGEALPLDEAFTHALLLDNAGDDLPASIAALRELHIAHPEANNVAIGLGTRLLFQGDASGIPLLEAVIARDLSSAVPCGQAIYDFHRRNGRLDDATATAKRINELAEGNRDADMERASVLPTDVFMQHGIDEAKLAEMKKQFADISEINDIYLVQKRCEHQPERRHYVVGFSVKNKWIGGRERKISNAMAALRLHVSYPGETSIIALDAGNEAYGKRLAAVAGSKLA